MADFSKSINDLFVYTINIFKDFNPEVLKILLKETVSCFQFFYYVLGTWLIKPRTVEYYDRVHYREGMKNAISKSTRRSVLRDYLGHFSVKIFPLTILI